MRLNKIYKEVAAELGLDVKDVEQAYKLYWKCIRETISGLNIKDADYEELENIRSSFNITQLGKMYVSPKLKYKKRKNDSNKETDTNVESHPDDM